MKIMINRKSRRHPWGGGIHFVTCLSDHLAKMGHDVVYDLERNIDVIIMIDPRPEGPADNVNFLHNYKLQNPQCKIIHRINDTDIARGTNFLDDIIIQSNRIADYTVFISQWVKEYYQKKGIHINESTHSVIINGCDSNWYYPKEKHKLTNKVRLITHHWSDNFMKGFDVYNYLDDLCEERDDIEFTYMGRYNDQYTPRNTSLIPPKYGTAVGEILRLHDVYVTAARWEACGMHHIEGSACGLPVLYHKDGGAIPEVCNSHGIQFDDPKTFVQGLDNIIENYDDYRERIDHQMLSMDRCLGQYYEVIHRSVDQKISVNNAR
jgi:hypothetical protein